MIGYTKVRFKFVLILISLSVLFAFFTPFSASVDNGNLIVDLGYARYEGKARPNGVSQWQGMRYAAPPVGKLRFAKPHDPPRTTKLQKARKNGRKCLATGGNPGSWYSSEDCLFLNVYAPSNATSSSKLPVFFYIVGGGFNVLALAGFDASGLVIASGHETIVVTFNYRVGPYGFLASKEIQESDSASLNNGLKDQRKALRWVQKHISQFGGDPNHVVMGGSSAGASAIVFQLAAYGGRDDNLFQGVVAQSVSMGPTLTVNESQYQYDALVQRTSCSDADDTLTCLRRLPTNTLQKQNIQIPYPGAARSPKFMYHPVIDGSFVPDSPYASFAEGAFVKVPSIFGDDTNAGTGMTPKHTNTIAQSDQFLTEQFPTLQDNHLYKIHQLYPQRPLRDHYNNSGAYWRQVSNVYGDMRYMCPSLFFSESVALGNTTSFPSSSSSSMSPSNTSSWTYRYNVVDPHWVALGYGVSHVVEQVAIWSPKYLKSGGRFTASYTTFNKNIVPVIQGYWTSFIKTLNPNTLRHPGSAVWEEWSGTLDGPGAQRLLFETNKTRMEQVDEGTKQKCGYLDSIAMEILQ